MMKYMMLILAGCIALTGCTTQRGLDAANLAKEAHSNYLNQDRSVKLVRLEAAEGKELMIFGLKSIEMNTLVTPLSMMPKSPDTVRAVADGVARVVGIAGAAAVGWRGVSALSDVATQGPTIVEQPQPLIVRPEVVQ